MLWRSCHFPFHADVAALLWGNALASAHNWFNWHLWYRDERQSTWWISSLCPCLFANSNAHCLSTHFSTSTVIPASSDTGYVTITHSTMFWLLVASFTSMARLSHHMLWQIYLIIYLINSQAMSTQYYLKKCSTSHSVPVAIRNLSVIRENCQVPQD